MSAARPCPPPAAPGPPRAGRLRLAYADAAPLAPGLWRLTLGFAPADLGPEAVRPVPPEALRLRPADGAGRAGLRATRTAWAQPGRVLTADVELGGSSTAAGAYLLRIEDPGLVDPAAAGARFFAPEPEAAVARAAPSIDYLTKDYSGFRHLMLSGINRLLPRWNDDGEADIGVTIVESLAYGADFLSYHQDAVATEAYLDTARRRTSIRRHLRLLGRGLSQGCASRLLVRLTVGLGEELPIPAGTAYLAAPELPRVVARDDPAALQGVVDGRAVYTQVEPLMALPELNRLEIAIPSRLRAGRIHFPVLSAADLAARAPGRLFGLSGTASAGGKAVLHPFRVRAVLEGGAAPAGGRELYVLEADPADALAHDLDEGAVVVGNLALAEFGRVVREELAAPEPDRPYRPALAEAHVVPVVPIAPGASAAALLAPEPERAVAAVTLREVIGGGPGGEETGPARLWHPAIDLLECSGHARRFIVEADDDGTASLRFGDGVFGRRPTAGARFVADYRVGALTAAVVGVGQLDTLVAPSRRLADAWRARVLDVANPIPPEGLAHAEPERRAILRGKAEFRIVRSCVTLDDFAAAAEAMAGVAEAVASVERAGSVELVVVRVRVAGDRFVAEPLLDRVRRAVADRMLPGRRLAVLGPRFARLSLAVAVAPERDAEPDRVRRAVEAALSAPPEGPFAPAAAGFGRPVFGSRVLQAAAGAPGVAGVRLVALARVGAAGAAPPAVVRLARDEVAVVARLDIALEGSP